MIKQGQDTIMERMPPREAKRSTDARTPVKSSPPITRITKRATGLRPAILFGENIETPKEEIEAVDTNDD